MLKLEYKEYKNMFIGEVSKRTGLSIKAIRFYEEKGLIRSPLRQGRYRVYTNTDIEILSLISEAKKLGVTLARLKNVIVYHDGVIDWARINQFLIEVKNELQAEMLAISNKVKKVEKCIDAMNFSSNTLDSSLKGRE
ncbi:MerR family transcriptional regulator [Vibrio sp. VB16]|uniref:MerR family transcriptional regulator n=1 Tax=Vibrio sp. VB16 TaxID=2785746 RepID=UPI001E43B3EB|nr:MerR family transcriptional regulator [Vibrio sp. VB16]UGA55843.1 MerR family transcriptional regulator [Vibrio sp. VB16]